MIGRASKYFDARPGLMMMVVCEYRENLPGVTDPRQARREILSE